MSFLFSSIFYLIWEENPPHWLIFMGLKPLICCIVGLSWWHSLCPARQISGQSERTDLSSLCTFQAWQSWLVGLGLSKYQAPQDYPIQWISSLISLALWISLVGSSTSFSDTSWHIHVAYFAVGCNRVCHSLSNNGARPEIQSYPILMKLPVIATHWS